MRSPELVVAVGTSTVRPSHPMPALPLPVGHLWIRAIRRDLETLPTPVSMGNRLARTDPFGIRPT
jgi:hypothetical protein